MFLIEVNSCKWKAIEWSETTTNNIRLQPLWKEGSLYFQFWPAQRHKKLIFHLEVKGLSDTFVDLCGHIFHFNEYKLTPHPLYLVFHFCRSKPAGEPAAGSSEEDTDPSPTSWLTSLPEMELDLEDPDNMPDLGDEELPHMLLPDSLSQLEEFGRHKRPRKVHRGHGRPRLFSDLWVRMGSDRWNIYCDWITILI